MDLRKRLRDETKDAHEYLDHSLGKLGVFDSRSNYAVYLSGLHQLYDHYGSEVDWASDQTGIACSVGDLQAAIENDLDHDILPPVDIGLSKSEFQGPERGWAAAYVMEGSAMGARYMVKQVEKSPRIVSGEIQITYLTKLAADSYARWPKFVAALELAECDVDMAVESAKAVFQTAAKVFQKAIQRHHQTSPSNTANAALTDSP